MIEAFPEVKAIAEVQNSILLVALDKTAPNLQATELSGKAANPIQIIFSKADKGLL